MKIYSSAFFDLSYTQKLKNAYLTQKIKSVDNTKFLPQTDNVLTKHLPTIFSNYCKNYEKLSFRDEAKSTEVGHLFEHMVLEYLKIEVEKEGKFADYSGKTSWNFWKKKDTFNIQITSGSGNSKHLIPAMQKAIKLLEKIYQTKNTISEQALARSEITP